MHGMLHRLAEATYRKPNRIHLIVGKKKIIYHVPLPFSIDRKLQRRLHVQK